MSTTYKDVKQKRQVNTNVGLGLGGVGITNAGLGL